jgi:chromate transport protein ChrA
MSAAAVGLIFTAVYRLWQAGYLKPGHTGNVSLADEPWWLVIATATYSSVEWFNVPIPLAIITGGVAGLAWWDVVGSKS